MLTVRTWCRARPATSSTSGSVRSPASARRRRAPQQLVVGRDARRGAAQALGQPARCSPPRTPATAPCRAVLLGQPVHDRVPAVGAARRTARRSRSARRSTAPGCRRATSRRRRRPRPGGRGSAIRTPTAAGRPKPSPPMAALRKPSGARAGQQAVQVGAARRRLLDDDRVGRDPLRQRGHHVRRPQRLARAAEAARRRRAAARRAAAAGRAGAPRGRAQTAAGSATTASCTGLWWASSAVVGDQRDRVPGSTAAPARRGTGGTPGRRRRPRRRGRPAPRAAAPGRRAGARRTAGGPAGSRRGRRTTPATPALQPLGQRDQGGPGAGGRPRRPRPPAPGRGAAPAGRPAPRRPPGRRPPRARSCARSGELERVVGGLGPVVAGHDRPAPGPRPSFGLVPGPRHRAGHVLRAGRLVHPHRVLAREPGEVARQERPVDRCRRSCWPTTPPAARGWSARWPARRPRCPARRWCAGSPTPDGRVAVA